MVVTKTWSGIAGEPLAADQYPDHVVVELQRWDGENKVAVVDETGAPLTAILNADNKWTYEFTGLPRLWSRRGRMHRAAR